MTSNASKTNVFLRNDTIFGTCQAIGDDFGFNANWLRVPLAAAMFLSPMGAVLFYLGLSLVVLLSRLVFKPEAAAVAEAVTARAVTVEANDDEQELIAA
jgi:phage shock protein PspC (stress-responsive transcriptional regulator)